MSTQFKNMLEQVHKLSRAEQLALISTIAHFLSEEEEGEALTDAALAQSIISNKPIITKGDKSIDPKALFGIWVDDPRNIEEIRKKAWRRN